MKRLQRQATAYDESCLPLGGSRRGSQPALSPDVDDMEGRARRDSLRLVKYLLLSTLMSREIQGVEHTEVNATWGDSLR